MINYGLIESRADDLARRFHEATPFGHLVVDGFLDPQVAVEAFRVFPSLGEMDALEDFRQRKAQDPNVAKFHPIFAKIIFEHLHSQRFLDLISRITGIPELRADGRLYASGLAQGGHGSRLNVHIDNSSHPIRHWYRRLNLLVYLNPNWVEEKGGHLELWSGDMSKATAILPVMNRMVLFATSRDSWHGYRQVVTPDGDTRKSINIYYFTEQSPNGTDYYHITSFRARKGELLNKLLYPLDNCVRALIRRLRPDKDGHAVLYHREKGGEGRSQD